MPDTHINHLTIEGVVLSDPPVLHYGHASSFFIEVVNMRRAQGERAWTKARFWMPVLSSGKRHESVRKHLKPGARVVVQGHLAPENEKQQPGKGNSIILKTWGEITFAPKAGPVERFDEEVGSEEIR